MKLESEKRLEDAISGNRPDRVPVAPLFYYFAGSYAGISFAELLNGPLKYREAMDRCWDGFKPWDVYYPPNVISRDMMALAMPVKTAYPGDELPDNEQMQFIEEELMLPEDYDRLLEPLLPLDLKKLRGALRREIIAWLRRRAETLTEEGAGRVLKAARDRLPAFFKSAYGDARDPETELNGYINFLKALIKLVADPEIDADFTIRYFHFMLIMAARVRGKSGLIDNMLAALAAIYRQLDYTRYDIACWRERGAAPLFGMALEGPFDTFSMGRSMFPFSSEDLFDRPEKVRECSDLAADFFVVIAELGIALTGVPRFNCACHRTSNDFISPTHFRELAFPSIRKITERLVERGVKLIFHCDGKWDMNLEHIATLPEGECVFQFDGRTDMQLARKTLGPGHCIFGDVPATMMAMGDETEVADYCEKLIREIGAEGRFILGAGCEIPPNAKPENVRAMLRAPFRGR